MKVKCLNISKYNQYDRLPLTVGKVYDVIEITHIPFNSRRYDDYTGRCRKNTTFNGTRPIYNLVNDKGEVSGYSDECVRLLTLDEVRELKLEDLGI